MRILKNLDPEPWLLAHLGRGRGLGRRRLAHGFADDGADGRRRIARLARQVQVVRVVHVQVQLGRHAAPEPGVQLRAHKVYCCGSNINFKVGACIGKAGRPTHSFHGLHSMFVSPCQVEGSIWHACSR